MLSFIEGNPSLPRPRPSVGRRILPAHPELGNDVSGRRREAKKEDPEMLSSILILPLGGACLV